MSVVIGEGLVDEIELAMGLDGIFNERRREKVSSKDEAINSSYLLFF